MLPLKALSMDHNSYSANEEWLNTSTHVIGFVLSIIGTVALLFKAEQVVESVIATIYGASLSLMFLSSSLYHAMLLPNYKRVLRQLDHVAIYLLIAGTYSPFLMLAVGGGLGIIGLVVIWLIAISGIVFKLTIGHKYPKLGVITYAIMGWLALLLIYPIYQSLSASGFLLLLLGGGSYSAGIPFYMAKSRHFSHAVWHLFVLAGAACHFFAIYWHVVGI